MTTAEGLLRLYPRAWRDRYGEEFLAIVGNDALHVQQMIDIVMGAIDAWLSLDVRRAAKTYSTASNEGGSTLLKSMMACERGNFRASIRDGLIGAGVMIVGSLILSGLLFASARAGWTMTREILKGLSFTAPFVISMPFWLMRGQPWKAQTAIVVGTLVVLVTLSYLAAT
ncbi:MAG TPA: hypothetical protein VHR17_14650 [Thermoanaerobaculia bacterium]|jgi:hypothetical protein|nr:hypothetical protein [Thermoanaerobaculia bacterium]